MFNNLRIRMSGRCDCVGAKQAAEYVHHDCKLKVTVFNLRILKYPQIVLFYSIRYTRGSQPFELHGSPKCMLYPRRPPSENFFKFQSKEASISTYVRLAFL